MLFYTHKKFFLLFPTSDLFEMFNLCCSITYILFLLLLKMLHDVNPRFPYAQSQFPSGTSRLPPGPTTKNYTAMNTYTSRDGAT